MTTLTQPAKLTPDDLLRMQDSASMELVDGQIVEKHVSILSSETEARITAILWAFLQTHLVARVFPASLGYQCFPDDPRKVRKADVSVVTLDRMNMLPPGDSGFMPIVPDLAVEVISTNDTVYELDEKVEEYREAGFPLIWVVDPRARTVNVHPANGKPFILSQDDEITAETVLPGFSCKVAEFFPPAK